MLQIGTLETYQDARRLGIYFQSFGNGTRLEQRCGRWAVWVCDDRAAAWAKKELEAFTRNPNDPRFPPPLSSPKSVLDHMRPEERQIVEEYLQGHIFADIARKLNVYERKVRRVIEWFETRLEQQQAEPGPTNLEETEFLHHRPGGSDA